MTAAEHTLHRTIKRRFLLEDHVTYSCGGCTFTVTDNGAGARKSWLRHLLAVEKRAGRVS